MDFDIDFIAHNNKLREANPYVKMISAISLLLIALILDNLIVDLIVFLITAFLIIAVARVSIKNYIKFISIPFIFALITCLFLIFFFSSGGAVLWDTGFFGIAVRESGLKLGVYTFCRVFACFSSLGFLTLTTPIADILNVLSKCMVPKILIEISLLMYNTVFIFLNQLDTMRNAQETRLGYVNARSAYKSLGLLFSNLFFKALDKSESLQNALDSRGYSGELPIYEPPKK